MDLLIPLDPQSEKPMYEQIYAYICGEIRSGGLAAGERLPSTRALAEHLKISRSTTQMAYDQLLAEGYVETRPYRGVYVAKIEGMVEAGPRIREEMETSEEESAVSCRIDFSPRGIDLKSFPYNTWRKLSRNTLVDDNREMFHSGNHQGEPGLREAIRGYLHSARGVECSADQIIVGAGSEYLLMLLSQILRADSAGTARRMQGAGKSADGLTPLDADIRIAMENPTYRQAYLVLRSLGHPVSPIEMDQSGMRPELLAASGARIAYVMPSHQFPTGAVMSVGRRRELLNWASEREGRYLIEDDYDSEFRYKGKPIPALQGMDRQGRVIYLGTFSKCIAPAIRVSYMVLPPELLRVYRAEAGFYASTVSRIDQNILYQFLAGGYFERHLNRMRAIYKAKHDMLLAAIRPLEERFVIHGENAGIHILLTERCGRTEEELIRQAAAAGVRVYGLSSYDIRATGEEKALATSLPGACGEEPTAERKPVRPATMVLGYASLDEGQIREGAELLTSCWCGCDLVRELSENRTNCA
ncbi:MAG: PLP-dependent aminotransferase family protein [Clostridiales bacterium]|nr:PLP-dependent aminotransferase family protein [Clostridiales bacterium]